MKPPGREPTAATAFWWSLAAHAAVVAVLASATLWSGCRARQRPREMITFFDLRVAPPAAGPAVPDLASLFPPLPAPPLPAPPEPEPPAPEPPTPAPPLPPRDIPDAAPKPPNTERKVERSTRRVRRSETPPPRPAPRAPTQREIRDALARGLPRGGTPVGYDGVPGWYLSLVRQAMYDAWDQPGDLSAAAGLRPVVRIRVMRDGTVSAREMIRRSGNAAMDESAMRAATAVTKLRPLPAEFQGPYRDITVEFELTGSGV